MTDVTQPRGLRERKKERTRRDVRAKALELFSAWGFDNVTVDDIAVACELSRATIFRYFPTKEDLVVGEEPERLHEFQVAFEQRSPDEPVFDSIRHALVALADRYQHERDQLLAASNIVASHGSLTARALELRSQWIATFARLIAHRRGNTSPDLHDQVLAGAVTSAVQAAAAHWLATDGLADLPDLLDEAVSLLATGFASTTT